MDFKEILVPIQEYKYKHRKPLRACCYIPKKWLGNAFGIIDTVVNLVKLFNDFYQKETLVEFNPNEDVFWDKDLESSEDDDGLQRDDLLYFVQQKDYQLCFSNGNFDECDEDLYYQLIYDHVTLVQIDEFVEILDRISNHKRVDSLTDMHNKLDVAIDKLLREKDENNGV